MTIGQILSKKLKRKVGSNMQVPENTKEILKCKRMIEDAEYRIQSYMASPSSHEDDAYVQKQRSIIELAKTRLGPLVKGDGNETS